MIQFYCNIRHVSYVELNSEHDGPQLSSCTYIYPCKTLNPNLGPTLACVGHGVNKP